MTFHHTRRAGALADGQEQRVTEFQEVSDNTAADRQASQGSSGQCEWAREAVR